MRTALLAAIIVATIAILSQQPGETTAQQTCTATATPANAASVVGGASSGSTVCLGPGVYRGRLIIGGRSDITLRGAGNQTIISGGFTTDGIVIVDSQRITVEDVKLFAGHPANVYVGRSRDVVLRRVDVGAGTIGVHVDERSNTLVQDSFIYAMSGDGMLVRRQASATAERNWIFINRGVGVSMVTEPNGLILTRNIISDNGGPGVFVGSNPPCAGLPGASLNVPACYLANPSLYYRPASLQMYANIVQSNGSTGVVIFPGTSALLRANRYWRNHMTGLFAWGAFVSSDEEEYDGNEEHAIEVRGFPDPRAKGHGYVAGSATINLAEVRNTQVYPPTGTLGGGIIVQGAPVNVINSRIRWNAGIAVSYQNGATGSVDRNLIAENRGAAVCLFSAGFVSVTANQVYGNATDKIGS